MAGCEHQREPFEDIPEAGWFCRRCGTSGGWIVGDPVHPGPVELGDDVVLPQGTAAAVYARSNHSCERCGTREAQFWSMHHRRPRGMGGSKNKALNEPSNILLLCGSGTTGCHGWVESHREEAYEAGLLVRMWQVPRDTPVTLWHGTYVLDDEGGVQAC